MSKQNVIYCEYYTQIARFNIVGNEKHQQIVLIANLGGDEIKVSCLIPEEDQIDVEGELPSTVLSHIECYVSKRWSTDKQNKLDKITKLKKASKELDIAWVQRKIAQAEMNIKHWKYELDYLQGEMIAES